MWSIAGQIRPHGLENFHKAKLKAEAEEREQAKDEKPQKEKDGKKEVAPQKISNQKLIESLREALASAEESEMQKAKKKRKTDRLDEAVSAQVSQFESKHSVTIGVWQDYGALKSFVKEVKQANARVSAAD